MKFVRRILLFKKEATEGVDPGLVAADAIRTTGLTITPYPGNKVSLNYDNSNFAASSQVNVNPHMGLQFGVMLSGSGTAGTATQWSELLQCCGFDEDVEATPDRVEHDAISSAIPSGTAYFLHPEEAGVNDLVHESNGMRGNMSLTLAAGQYPNMQFNFLGSYVEPVTSALVTPDFTGWTDPVTVTDQNTPTITIDSWAACLQSITHNCNNQLIYENIPGCSGARINDANFGGTLVVKAPDLGTKDVFNLVESHAGVTTFAAQIVHGTAGGAIVQLDYSAMQFTDVSEVDVNGSLGYQFTFIDVGNTLLITTK